MSRIEKLIEKELDKARREDSRNSEVDVHTAPSGTQYVYPSEVLRDPRALRQVEQLSAIIKRNRNRR